MAQHDVHRLGGGYVVDCQADVFEQYDTRFVIPLVPLAEVSAISAKLNPTFLVEGQVMALFTQFAGAVPRADLGNVVQSLGHAHHQITNALDMLISGY